MNSLEETFDSPEAAALYRVKQERDEAREALADTAKALERFGDHAIECDTHPGGRGIGACDCGFGDAVLRAAQP